MLPHHVSKRTPTGASDGTNPAEKNILDRRNGQKPPVELPARRAMCGRLRVVKGLITSQRWSEQPCVRPLRAVHMTAGHNALRGSGPGQQLAFDDAMAHVGCPDHRIDRFCITCCRPFPTVSSRRCRRDLVQGRLALSGQCDGFPIALALGHHCPGHSSDLVGECDRSDFRRAALE